MGDLLGSNEMNVALFGYGRIGQVHYSNILNGKRVMLRVKRVMYMYRTNCMYAFTFKIDYVRQ